MTYTCYGNDDRVGQADMWPGITSGLDARCSCTRAPLNGVYQVKLRDIRCLVHGLWLGTVARCEVDR